MNNINIDAQEELSLLAEDSLWSGLVQLYQWRDETEPLRLPEGSIAYGDWLSLEAQRLPRHRRATLRYRGPARRCEVALYATDPRTASYPGGRAAYVRSLARAAWSTS